MLSGSKNEVLSGSSKGEVLSGCSKVDTLSGSFKVMCSLVLRVRHSLVLLRTSICVGPPPFLCFLQSMCCGMF